MRVLLQDKKSKLFFKDIDAWVSDKAQARDFNSAATLVDFCILNKIRTAQIVYAFEDPAMDITLEREPGLTSERLPSEEEQ